MRRRREAIAALAVTGLLLLGGSCGGGSGGGSTSVRKISSPRPPPIGSPDPRCVALTSPFPPGFDFVPGRDALVWTAEFSPPTMLPFDVDEDPPQVSANPAPFLIPFDSDGDGVNETFLAPVPDDVEVPLPDLGLLTASSYEEVIFFDPQNGGLVTFEISVPAGFAASDNPLLPAPGGPAVPRTAVSTLACVKPAAGALDSRGDSIATSVPSAGFCAAGQPSYLARFTSGAALIGDRLFVSASNLGDDAGTPDPQFLPGAVLVYDVDLGVSPPTLSPNATTPVIVTTDFNPTHVTAFQQGGRDFVLVGNSGAIGIEADFPSTPDIEGAGIALTDASIDVIDASSLFLVATIPLGRAGLYFDRLAIDPTGRVAAAGSAVARHLFAVDLDALVGLDPTPAVPAVLDGSSGPDAVIFDADAPFGIPARLNGAPVASCPGFTVGAVFNDAGDRIYVVDFCDGTGTAVLVDLVPAPPFPVPRGNFSFGDQINLTEPLRTDTLGQPRQPGAIEIRPGRPGIDYDGPDVYFLVGDPGLLCGIDIE